MVSLGMVTETKQVQMSTKHSAGTDIWRNCVNTYYPTYIINIVGAVCINLLSLLVQ